MHPQSNISKMTFETLRWVYSKGRSREFLALRSPASIRHFIDTIFPDQNESFKKGTALVDCNALFDWICETRGYVYGWSDFALRLLKFLVAEKKAQDEKTRLLTAPATQPPLL